MQATVCLPWRATEDRIPAHDTCLKFWHDHGFDTIQADSDANRPFLCNAARINAVRQATTDVVIIADAGTIPHNVSMRGMSSVAIFRACPGRQTPLSLSRGMGALDGLG